MNLDVAVKDSVRVVVPNHRCQILYVQPIDRQLAGEIVPDNELILPGGGCQPDESVLEAIRRETREETSLEIGHARLVLELLKPDKLERVSVFWAHSFSGSVKINPDSSLPIESQAYFWIDPRRETDLPPGFTIRPKHKRYALEVLAWAANQPRFTIGA